MKNHGVIIFKLDEVMEKRKMSKYRLSKLTQLSTVTIQRYCNGLIKRIDLNIMSHFCNALNCNLCDILEYQKK